MSKYYGYKVIADILVEVANDTVGARESGGNNRGKEIEKFQKFVDGIASGEPWCMGWMQWVVGQVCEFYDIPHTLFKSEHCLTVWTRTPEKYRRTEPKRGYAVIFRSKGLSGHVALCTSENVFAAFGTIEGNTNKQGSREGDGVYRKIRHVDENGALRIVGYIDLPQMILDKLTARDLQAAGS